MDGGPAPGYPGLAGSEGDCFFRVSVFVMSSEASFYNENCRYGDSWVFLREFLVMVSTRVVVCPWPAAT